MEKLKYNIIGAGGIGGYYGGRLASAGKDVRFLFHSDFDHVKTNGLRVDSVQGSFHLEQVNAYRNAADMPVCDVVLVCLKTTSNHLLDTMLPGMVHPGSVVMMVQNGLGVEEDLKARMPCLNLAGGLAFICSRKEGPGHIVHLDHGLLNIGGFEQTPADILRQVQADFADAGVGCELKDDLYAARWNKLLWNIPYNGLTVVLDSTTDMIMRNPVSRQLVRDLMVEVVNAAAHCGVKPDYAQVERLMTLTDRMKPYATSMKLDYDCNRPMEIDAIYTRPVLEARKNGFDMVRVSVLEKQLRYMQEHRRFSRADS